MKSKLQLSILPLFLACFILATVPLLFGAVHPIVSACYVVLVLVGFGGWFCFFVPSGSVPLLKMNWLFPLLLILTWSIAQAIPIPLSWVEYLSPLRGLRITMVNDLAGTNQQMVSLSDHGLLSLTRSVLLLSIILFFYGLKQIMRQNYKAYRIIVLIIVLAGVFESLYGLFQFLNPQLGVLWLPLKYRAASGTIIYKNQYASLLNMCWPLALASVVVYLRCNIKKTGNTSSSQAFNKRIRYMSDKEKQAPLFLLATALIILAVLFSLSRGGVISMLLIMVLLNFVLPITRKARFIFAGLFTCFVVSYGSLLGWETLLSRFDTIGQGGAGRVEIYIKSLTMLKEHWATGIGFGSYSLLSPIYLKGISNTAHFDNAHNEYLQLAIELGVPLASFLFLWILCAMGIAWFTLRKDQKKYGVELPSRLIIGGAAFCGLVGFLFHGIADFGWRLPANLFYAAALAALLSYSLENEKD